MSRLGPDRDANLGHVQKHVLLVLSTRGDCSCTDWSAWYPLNEGQVRGAIRGLTRRGLVDAAGWEHGSRGARVYKITRAGDRALEAILDSLPEDLIREVQA